jgi:AcrR family transcriptional regulator
VGTTSKRPGEAAQRRRLSVGARRDELLRLGLELFSTRAYDELGVEEIAERAGVSRGLLYHYFPTKRHFYLAVSRAAAAEVAAVTTPDPSLSPEEQLRTGIDAFLVYAEEHPHGFLTAYRGSLAGDAEVRAIVEQGRQRQAARILDVVMGAVDPPPLLRLAVHGWIALAQDITARWLQARELPREAVCELLTSGLIAIVRAGRAPARVG